MTTIHEKNYPFDNAKANADFHRKAAELKKLGYSEFVVMGEAEAWKPANDYIRSTK